MQYRQGDVLIERISTKMPKGCKPIPKDKGRVILAYGEATGHAHVAEGDAILMGLKPNSRSDTIPRYLRVGKGGARITHDEHDPIELTPGLHRIMRQREYVPPAPRPVSRPGASPGFRGSSRAVWD